MSKLRPFGLDTGSIAVDMSMHGDFDCDEVFIDIRFSGSGSTMEEVRSEYEDVRNTILKGLTGLGMPEDAYTETPFTTSPRRTQVYEPYIVMPGSKIDSDFARFGTEKDEAAVARLKEALETGVAKVDYRRVAYVRDGYDYSAGIQVTLDMSLGIHEAIYDFVLELDESVSAAVQCSISYRLHDRDEARRALMGEAVKKAKKDAEALATAAGESLGRCRHVSYAASSSVDRSDVQSLQGALGYTDIPILDRQAEYDRIFGFQPKPVNIRCDVDTVWDVED